MAFTLLGKKMTCKYVGHILSDKKISLPGPFSKKNTPMDTISWPCLQEILRWIPGPRDQARLARTCRYLRAAIESHSDELAIAFMTGEWCPLATACRHYGKRPLYLDVCFRLGLDRINTREAFLAACQFGPEWAVDRLLGSSDQSGNVELGLWRACAGGHVGIARKMIKLGATMVRSGISRLPYAPNEAAQSIYAMLKPLVGTRRSDGGLYF